MAALLKLSTLQFVSVTTLDDCSEVCLRSPMCNSHVSAGHVQYSQQMLLLPPSKVRIIPKATFGSLLSARPSHDASLVSLDDCSDGVRWSCYHCSFLRLQMGQWQCLDGILALTTKSRSLPLSLPLLILPFWMPLLQLPGATLHGFRDPRASHLASHCPSFLVPITFITRATSSR